MIAPTRLAVGALVAGAPATLLVALLLPGPWYAALAWPLAVLALVLVDVLAGAGAGRARIRLEAPASLGVGDASALTLHVAIDGRAPGRAWATLDPGPLLRVEEELPLALDLDDGKGAVHLPLRAVRRGSAQIGALWLRWRGPLGLVARQRRFPLDTAIAIVPDLRPVRQGGARIFRRHGLQGLVAQVDRGEGSDLDALVEFRAGMDRRAIDWKHSARLAKLHAKEFRSERNNTILFAVDCGRQMSEPVAGLPRLDRIVSAMLLTAWVALKLGDKVALAAFDSRPRILSGPIVGAGAFGALQRLAAGIDYSGEETNYTHALTTIAARLTRRSMIVLFTEFTDLASADFMVRAAARLVETHLLLVVVLRDEELETLRDRAPESADDVTRSITAAALLRDRLMVLTRLRHLGAQVIESEHDQVPERLVQAYVDLKRRNRL